MDKSFYAFQPQWSSHQRIRQPRIGRLFQPHRQMTKLSLCFPSFRSLFNALSPPLSRVSTRRGRKLFLGTGFQGAFDQNFSTTASVLWVPRWLAATQGARRQCVCAASGHEAPPLTKPRARRPLPSLCVFRGKVLRPATQGHCRWVRTRPHTAYC